MNISIVLPLYNKAPFVKETLQSVFDQTKLPFELVIVDDKSTDGSLQIARDFLYSNNTFTRNVRVEIVELEENGGVSVARNVGFEKTTGDTVVFLDGDDLYANDLLEVSNDLMINYSMDFLIIGIHLFPSNTFLPDLGKLNQKLIPIFDDVYRIEEPLKAVSSMHFYMGLGSNVIAKRKWMESIQFYEKRNFYEGIDYWYKVLKRVLRKRDNSIGLLMGNRIKVREVAGSASRKKFGAWYEIAEAPLLNSCKGSENRYDKLMMGVVGKRWLRYSIKNLKTVKQKIIFIYKYKHLFKNQLYYFFLRTMNR
ncbi:Glycosyltransferase involved in cell wall bisynthesis [Tenacibaculum sp. MAR_2009_124]|uniref:glycosyltransferase family 2 protein n=1 Tax=Tenacibaculum sp. MAR_2009_124 TaxID=1250059 RepID=UPI00089B1E10|nr:glycosyltransferase family 2 protein [Tenacibaculum sp. MAR_2009_124]SEB37743.1 Glycosyltransferase involved in cell wall bisynthesis [Tenacibaculum sp. MAR_2009_124]